MRREILTVLAQSAESQQGIPVRVILEHSEDYQREIGHLLYNIVLIKNKCREGLDITNKIISHPNYDKHNEKISHFANLWNDIIEEINQYENKLDQYFAFAKQTSFHTMAATYERRLRKILKSIEESLDNILSSASILQDMSDETNLGANFHMNYDVFIKFKNDVKHFISVLKDKDFDLLDNDVVSVTHSNKLMSVAEFDENYDAIDWKDTYRNLDNSLQPIINQITTVIQNISVINNGIFKEYINAYILESLQKYLRQITQSEDINVLAFKTIARSISTDQLNKAIQSTSPEDLVELKNNLQQLSQQTNEIKSLEDQYKDIISGKVPVGSLDIIIKNIEGFEQLITSHTGEDLEEKPEDTKTGYDEILNQFKAFQTKYPITFVARNAPPEVYQFYAQLEQIINSMVKEETSESATASARNNIIKLSADLDLQQFFIDALEIVENLYSVVNEKTPEGYELKSNLLNMINTLQDGINKYENKFADPKEQEDLWIKLNTYLVTIYNGLQSLEKSLNIKNPKDIINLSDGTQTYATNIMDEIQRYQELSSQLRDFHEVKIPARTNTFVSMQRDDILNTLKGYVLEISNTIGQTTEWAHGSKTSSADMEALWDELAKGIEDLSNKLNLSGAKEYELTSGEFLKAISLMEDYINTNAPKVNQYKESIESVFPSLNQMIYLISNTAQKENTARNIKKNKTNFGAMLSSLHNVGAKLQDSWIKISSIAKAYENIPQQINVLKTENDIKANTQHSIIVKSQFFRGLRDFFRGLKGKDSIIYPEDVNEFINTYANPQIEAFTNLENELQKDVTQLYKEVLNIVNKDTNHSIINIINNMFPTVIYQSMQQAQRETTETYTMDTSKGPSYKSTTKSVT